MALPSSIWRLVPAVRPPERPRFAFFFALAAIITMAQTLGLAGSEALFLAHPGLGPGELPLGFVAASLATVAASLLYAMVVGNRRNDRLFVALLFLAAGMVGLLGLTLDGLGAPALFALFCAFYVFQAVLAISHFQTFATDYFDTLASKRVFPLFTVGASMGGTLGGLLAVLLSQTAPAESLVIGWSLSLALAGMLVLWMREPLRRWAPLHQVELDESSAGNLRSAVRFAGRSPLARWLTLAVVGMVFAGLLLQYLYLDLFARAYPSAAALSTFFGIYLAASNLLEIAIGNGLTPWLIRRFGTAQANLLHPVLTLAAFALLIVDPRLPAAITARLNRESLENVLAAPLRALAYNGLPHRFRGRMRVLLEGVVAFAAMSLAGAALMLLEGRLAFSAVAGVGVAAAALYAFACWRVRTAYLESLVEAVRRGRLDRDLVRESLGDGELSALAVAWEAILEDEPGPVAPAVLELADWLAGRGHIEPLRRLAGHRDPRVRHACVEALRRAQPPIAPRFWLGPLGDEDASVRAVAAAALGAEERSDPELRESLQQALIDADPLCRAEIALALGQEGDATLRDLAGSPDPRLAAPALARLPARLAWLALERIDDPNPEVRAAALEGAAHDPAAGHSARAGLSDSSPAVRIAALRAIAQRVEDDRETLLAERLDDPVRAVRNQAADALRPLGASGALAAGTYLAGERPWTVDAALRAIGSAGPKSRPRLEDAFRQRVWRCWRHMQALRSFEVDAGLPRRFLFAAVGNALARNASLAFKVLEALEDPPIVRSVQRALAGPPSRERGDALEVLTNLGVRDAAGELAMLLDVGDVQDRVEGNPELMRLWTEAEVLAWARESGDRFLARAADAVEAQPSEASQEEISFMEGLLALRRVPFFRHLSLEQLEAVSRVMSEVDFVQGEVLMREGEPGEDLFILLSGECSFFKDYGTPEQRQLNTMRPVACIGEMAVLDQSPRSATAVLSQASRLLRLEGERFRELILETPEISFEVFRVLTERVRQAESR